MSVVLIENRVTKADLQKAGEDYGKFIKIVVDVKNNLVAIGGEWHVDGEKILLERGSQQQDLWGGGVDLDMKNIETIALINLRPSLDNNSQEILDKNIRDKFVKIVKEKFEL